MLNQPPHSSHGRLMWLFQGQQIICASAQRWLEISVHI